MMKPTKIGQVVKFHSPLEDEDPNQVYVILEIKSDEVYSRVDIKALRTGLPFASITTVRLEDLTVVGLPTDELIGHIVTVVKQDQSQATGRVIRARESKINLDLNKTETGVTTNVYLTIIDKNGVESQGTLFVN